MLNRKFPAPFLPRGMTRVLGWPLLIGWGLVATLAMSVLMILEVFTGIAPIPSPIPEAIVGGIVSNVFGGGVPKPLIMVLAVASHFGYGGFWSAVLAILARPVTIWKGIGLGIFLWFIMQIVVLPLLGWGFFGVAITPRIAVATLILHLLYGAVLGWLLDRKA